MRTITKSENFPPCLTVQPPGLDWRKFTQTPCHALVAENLRSEQQHLCCYCEAEIAGTDSHVEHLVPRSRDAAKTYDYGNLAASCNGGAGQDQHCGHRKGGDYDTVLFVSPHSPAVAALFVYGIDGSIAPADKQSPAAAEYMRALLGLDCPSLAGRRRAHARRIIGTLGASPAQNMLQWARSYYLEPDSTGELRQFPSLSRTLLERPTTPEPSSR